MYYNFIEIGTSDFRTIIETSNNNSIGLSIEPIKLYLDNLPDKPNVTKVNAAISKLDGSVNIFYVSPEKILEYKLPNWVRGCNSINTPHPTIKNLLKEKHNDIVTVDTVKVLSWSTLINEYNISGIGLLKIDTEGHDLIILEEYFKICLNNDKLFANEIIFEYNELTDKKHANEIITKFKNMGYNGSEQKTDYILKK